MPNLDDNIRQSIIIFYQGCSRQEDGSAWSAATRQEYQVAIYIDEQALKFHFPLVLPFPM